MPYLLILLPILQSASRLLIKIGSSKLVQECCESGRKIGCELLVDQTRNFLHDKMMKQALIQVENVTLWTQVADAIQSQLNVIETSIRELQTSKLYSALTYIRLAQTSLSNNNFKTFKENIVTSEQLAIESLPTLDAQHKMTAYTILIMTQFIRESQYGKYPLKGLRAIYNVLDQMRYDAKLIVELNKAIGSKIFFTSNDESLIEAALTFSFEFSNIIKQLADIHNYSNECQSQEKKDSTEAKEYVCHLFFLIFYNKNLLFQNTKHVYNKYHN